MKPATYTDACYEGNHDMCTTYISAQAGGICCCPCHAKAPTRSRFLDRGETTDGVTIQIRMPGTYDDGWYLVTVATKEGSLISISCTNVDEAEQAAKWMEQYSAAEIPDKMRERQGRFLYNIN